MTGKRKAFPLRAGKLTKEVTSLLETEGKEAEEGAWEVGTREAALPQGV